MFRDLKEYQEIAKIYTEKVSKPEDLEERVRGGGMQSRIKPFEKPSPQVSGQRDNRPQMKGGITFKKPTPSVSNKRAEMSKRRREMQNKPSNTDASGKVIPTTAEIRAKNPNAVGGGNAGASTDSGVTQGKGGAPVVKKTVVKTVVKKPEVSTTTKQGKPRTKAQMMAAKRIAAGKSISDVKQSSKDAMKARAAERFAAFKAKRAAGKMNEDVTPYDIVLEYLLSSEQVATIEEANYVMTEMDAETIQSVVKEFMGGKPGDGYIGPKFLNIKNPVAKFINKMRDESPIGGNKRVDDTRKGSGDKKVGEKIYYGK